MQAEKIATLVKAANIECESFWPSLFAKLVEKRNIEDLIMNVGAGGGGAAPVAVAGGAAAAPAAEEKKEEKVYNLLIIYLLSIIIFSTCLEFSNSFVTCPIFRRKPRKRVTKKWDSAYSMTKLLLICFFLSLS